MRSRIEGFATAALVISTALFASQLASATVTASAVASLTELNG